MGVRGSWRSGTLHMDRCMQIRADADGDAAGDKCSVTGCRGVMEERVEGYRGLRTYKTNNIVVV